MESPLREALEARGMKPRDIRHVPGVETSHAYRHYTGEREVSAKAAIAYERALGIPRSELRPDLWPPKEERPGPDTRPIGWNAEEL